MSTDYVPQPDARSGIEGFYQGRKKAAGKWADCIYGDDVWYEWNILVGAEMVDDMADESITSETDLSGWEVKNGNVK
jgi:hypothetical protein